MANPTAPTRRSSPSRGSPSSTVWRRRTSCRRRHGRGSQSFTALGKTQWTYLWKLLELKWQLTQTINTSWLNLCPARRWRTLYQRRVGRASPGNQVTQLYCTWGRGQSKRKQDNLNFFFKMVKIFNVVTLQVQVLQAGGAWGEVPGEGEREGRLPGDIQQRWGLNNKHLYNTVQHCTILYNWIYRYTYTNNSS